MVLKESMGAGQAGPRPQCWPERAQQRLKSHRAGFQVPLRVLNLNPVLQGLRVAVLLELVVKVEVAHRPHGLPPRGTVQVPRQHPGVTGGSWALGQLPHLAVLANNFRPVLYTFYRIR